MQRHTCSWYALVAFVAGVGFVVLLMIGLGGCQPVSDDDPLPRLLAVIEMPSDVGILTARSVIHPNGLAYVVNKGGTIAVLDGPRLVKLISWPSGPLEAALSQGISVHPDTGWIYVTDQIRDAVHVSVAQRCWQQFQTWGIVPRLSLFTRIQVTYTSPTHVAARNESIQVAWRSSEAHRSSPVYR
jgi:hypothetical protein